MAECSKKDSSWTIKCVSILPVCCKEYPAVLPELSTLQFLVFLTVKKSWSDRLGSSYRVRSQRWELGHDPAHWDQTGGCFSASGHGGLNEEMMEREEDIFSERWMLGKEEEEGRITILLSLFQWWTASYLCWVSGGVRGHTSSVPADLQDSAQESRMDPLHTAENTEKHLLVWLLQGWDASNNIRSHLKRLHSTDLLQGRSTQLDGDVSEEAVSFCAEVSDDVRVCVRSSEELHLTFCYLKTLRQDSLHCNITSIKLTPKVTKERDKTYPAPWDEEIMWFVGKHTVKNICCVLK